MKSADLSLVSASIFYEGMPIDGRVYFKYANSFVLLCQDVTITPALLEKFHETESENQELFVEKEHLDDILELSKKFEQMRKEQNKGEFVFEKSSGKKDGASNLTDLTARIDLQNDYKDIKNRLDSVMDMVKNENKVPLEAFESLTDELSTKIELTDPALLIECINNLRDPDDYLNAHTTNVAMLNGMMGTWLKLPQEDIDTLVKVGLLHDVGKLRIPPEILDKPGALTDEEFKEMKRHTVYGYEILKLSGETDNNILEGVLSHHEKINGTGYPSGLKITQISSFARITSVSDVYDAMVAKRVYKKSHSPFEILAEFALHKFSDLDISIVNVFLDKMPSVLTGKNVLLSDGRSAKVAYVNPLDFANPIVEIDGDMLSTGHELQCIALENFLITVDD